MKKTILISMAGLALFLTGCTQQAPTKDQNINQQTANVNQDVNTNQPTDQTTDWKTYQDTNMGVSFSLKYPSSWTYQKFSCNIEGVVFCPLAGNSPSNCGQTCGMDSPEQPIYLYPHTGTEVFEESETWKYWLDAKISLRLIDSKYREIYTNMISTFKLIK